MTAALAFAQLALMLLPTITSGAEHLWAFITATRTAAQQTGEWTPALEAAYQTGLIIRADAAASIPDNG